LPKKAVFKVIQKGATWVVCGGVLVAHVPYVQYS